MKTNVIIKSMKETQYKYGKEIVKLDVSMIQYLRQAGYQIFVSSEPQELVKPVYTVENGTQYVEYETSKPNAAYIWYLDDMPNFRVDNKEL